ncbi:MAG: hypothetical protein WC091_18400 [Sulfuricellaceae bacterium]
MEQQNGMLRKIQKSTLMFIFGCCLCGAPVLSMAQTGMEQCQDGWVVPAMEDMQRSYKTCLEQQQEPYQPYVDCSRIFEILPVCFPTPDTLCSVNLSYTINGVLTGISSPIAFTDGCVEPDFSEPPPDDPTADPPSDDPTSYCPI